MTEAELDALQARDGAADAARERLQRGDFAKYLSATEAALPRRGPSLIFQAIPKIMAEVGAVSKSGKNKEQGYAFRRLEDVYAAVQLVMARHGVFVVPYVVSVERDERQSKSGGTMFCVRAVIDHAFYASDGSSVVARTIGEAIDSSDKASNKVMSGAMKYALVEVFCIPTEAADDGDREGPKTEPSAAAKAKPHVDVDEHQDGHPCPNCTHPMIWHRKKQQWQCWQSKGGCDGVWTDEQLAEAEARLAEDAPQAPTMPPKLAAAVEATAGHPAAPKPASGFVPSADQMAAYESVKAEARRKAEVEGHTFADVPPLTNKFDAKAELTQALHDWAGRKLTNAEIADSARRAIRAAYRWLGEAIPTLPAKGALDPAHCAIGLKWVAEQRVAKRDFGIMYEV